MYFTWPCVSFQLEGCVVAQVHKKATYICGVQLVTVPAGPLLEQSVIRSVVYSINYFVYYSSGNRTPGSRFYSDLLDTSVCMHQPALKGCSKR